MTTAWGPDPTLTRRGFAAGAVALGAGVVAGCGEDEEEPTPTATTGDASDLLIVRLRDVIDQERLARSTYQRASRFTKPTPTRLLRSLADQNLGHVMALREILDRIGAGPNQDDSRNQPPFVRDARSGLAESLRAARRMIATHTDLLTEVAPADRRAVTSVLANHAQHEMLIREAQGRPLRSETVPGES